MILLTKFRSSTSTLLRPNKVHRIVFDYFCFILLYLISVWINLENILKGIHTMNTGKGNGAFGTREMGELLYSGECRQTFWGMSLNIPRKAFKHWQTCIYSYIHMKEYSAKTNSNKWLLFIAICKKAMTKFWNSI